MLSPKCSVSQGTSLLFLSLCLIPGLGRGFGHRNANLFGPPEYPEVDHGDAIQASAAWYNLSKFKSELVLNLRLMKHNETVHGI